MSPIYDTTIAGVPSRSIVYSKIMENIRELQDHTALMAHLHNTENNDMDKLLAKGWLGMSEMFKMMGYQITELAKNKLS